MATNNGIEMIDVPFKSSVIILMNHPVSLTLYKYTSIKVLSGTVTINGYELTKKSDPVEVFSSEITGLTEIVTDTYECIWKKKEYAKRLEDDLINITGSESFASEILKQFQNTTVAISVTRIPLPHNVEFLRFYYPEILEFNAVRKSPTQEYYILPNGKKTPLQFDVDEEKLASDICGFIRIAKLAETRNPRILVCGQANTGKSTLLRFLLNKVLNVFPRAYYLDTDPGQAEFTPPGAVSLTLVKKPVFGPPFSHQLRPKKMMFVGDVSPSHIELYCMSILELMTYYSKEFADEPLFINTMGWMEGIGLECLKSTIKVVEPTILVEIVREDEETMFDYRDYMPPDSQYYQLCCYHKKNIHLMPRVMRELSLLSYLGKSQPPFFGAATLNGIKPVCVSFDKIAVFIFPGGNIFSSRMIEAINNSIVALCCVPESSILESDIPEFTKTLEFDAEHECLGYGMVTAVDERAHLLMVITPLKLKELHRVNAIVKGKVTVPDVLITGQDIYHTQLPFTDERLESGSKESAMDVSMVSLKFLSEGESSLTEAKVNTSVKTYRKKVRTKDIKK